jgi:hypothetical protein
MRCWRSSVKGRGWACLPEAPFWPRDMILGRRLVQSGPNRGVMVPFAAGVVAPPGSRRPRASSPSRTSSGESVLPYYGPSEPPHAITAACACAWSDPNLKQTGAEPGELHGAADRGGADTGVRTERVRPRGLRYRLDMWDICPPGLGHGGRGNRKDPDTGMALATRP